MTRCFSELRYPVLCVSRGIACIERTPEELTTCTKVALRNGWYRKMLLVDSSGQAIRVRDAIKLRGVGLFWGYNVFLNQRIRVELEPAGEPYAIALHDVKELVLGSFRRRHGWSTRGDYDELQSKVRNAGSISEIIEWIG